MKITGYVRFFKHEVKTVQGSEWHTKHVVVETTPHYDEYSNTVTYGQFAVEYTKRMAERFPQECEKEGALITAFFDPQVKVFQPDGNFKGIYTHNRGYIVSMATNEEAFAFHRDLSAAESQVKNASPEGVMENALKQQPQHVDTTQPQASDVPFEPVNNEKGEGLPF